MPTMLSPACKPVIALVLMIALGVIGAFLPIVQGWIFVLAGLAVLSSHSVWARAILDRIKKAGRQVKEKVVKGRRKGGAEPR